MIDHQAVRKELRGSEWVNTPFKMLSVVSAICSSNLEVGREFVIRTLAKRDGLDVLYRNIVDELAMQVGLYPYASDLESLSLRSAFTHASNRAEKEMENYVLHSSQTRILRKLMAGESVILSAPTSFGKSLLIDVIISEKNFSNIVLILPTLALVEETRRRMSRFVGRYNILTTGGQEQSERNIFVLTQERFLAMETEIPDVDFFAIDEFYKLSISGEGDRATLLNQALIKLVKTGAQFYLLGPSIKSIPEIVTDRLKCSFYIEDFQTVAIELHVLSKKPTREEAFANLLDGLEGQTLVYCQSPASTRKLLKNYLAIRDVPLSEDEELIEAAQWTSRHYHDEWLVSVALMHGVGIHHGRLPRSLGRFMIRAFEEGKLNILLCTSTLIEGVNTAAKNVVVYDGSLNKKPLDFFTFNNIRGRSGRMFKHFVGSVYCFDAPPEENLPFVDIPSFNPTETTPSSILINLPEGLVPVGLQGKVDLLTKQDLLPVEVLRKLSGIEPEYLLDTARYLYGLDVRELQKLVWSSRPRYEDIKATSEIIWKQLGGAGTARQSSMRTSSMMTLYVWRLYALRSVPRFRREMIKSQIDFGTSPDDSVENVLAFLRGWASFNYPKYLISLNEVLNVVLVKRGLKGANYIAFAASIEHLFQPSSFSTLEEYGLPTEISEKLMAGQVFSKDDGLEYVVNKLKEKELGAFADGVFERRVIEDFQEGIGSKVGATKKK
ncbi:DEAD/DEAH box helicase [Pseudomonas viridiflava]|uniref:DEAD/DEAH box helicase n=1 Tax=Pseudomonas neuropathica TaxID=2730425 RepID=UPI000F037E37